MKFRPDQLPFECLSIPDAVVRERATGTDISAFAFINDSEPVRVALTERYGRRGLVLKMVPLHDPKQHPGTAIWGRTALGMSSLVQNLLAIRGLAPRVYGLVRVNGEFAAQVTDYIPEGTTPPRVDEIEAIVRQLGIKSRHKNLDLVKHNWRDGLFVDFSGWYLDRSAIDALVNRVCKLAKKRRSTASSGYQQVSGLDLSGDRPDSRDLPSAVAKLAVGSAVLDIGCNLGHFSRRASEAGALRVVGVEKDAQLARLAMTINALLGYWNVDVVQGKLPQDLGAVPSLDFDLIICLSAIKYIGDLAAPAWLSTLAPNLWLEGHGDVPAEYYWGSLQPAYGIVERLPDAVDLKVRAQFLCTREEPL